MSADDRTPVLVGAGQLTQRDVDPAAAASPVAMMADVARRAADDAGGGAALLAAVDRLAVVNVFSWPYVNAPALLVDAVGARPRTALYTTVGGNTPQWLVNETAAAIAAGDCDVALLVGAEAVRSVLRGQKAGTLPSWPAGEGACTVVGDAREGVSPHEAAHGMTLPVRVYPLFENALRAAAGRSLAAHRAHVGRLCAGLAAVAAENPHAWFRDRPSADAIMTPGPTNRMIAFPYPKRACAIIEVDQAAGVLMTSAGAARRLGIPASRWVYVWGTGQAHDRWFVSERASLATSPGIREAGRQALAAAGVDIARIEHLDLYSCFPSAVQLACDALGIPDDDPRPRTLTGGLPYFGGPGNNYAMHGIAEAMARVRARPGSLALTTGLGWYVTKHAVGIYSAAPKPGPWTREDPTARQAAIDAVPAAELVESAAGEGTIETYTVVHDRDGTPSKGIVVGRLDDGRRFLANTPPDRALLDALEAAEGVGRRGRVRPDGAKNVFTPA